MASRSISHARFAFPAPMAVLQLLKPITWFAPMWAYGCGIVSSGQSIEGRWVEFIAGVLLCGPFVCGTSQAVNDWFDRHVDAINEPQRPIPSGRIPGRWGLFIAIAWTAASMMLAMLLGPWGFGATLVGLALAWAYSAPPFRLKRNGWWGNSAVGVCYEGLPWITGAAVIATAMPAPHILLVAALYSLGAHGIMTLNDFKSVDGDRAMGIDSLPVLLGVERAARVACAVMALPQCIVIGLLVAWGAPWHAGAVVALLIVQLGLMIRLLDSPRVRAPWYNATGTTLYVLGMLATAHALAGAA
ncbi:chlorophyll synthase [Dongia mobilis]|uniref:Chlorophyll synthase n=1 Tax=Dongia mobilis TaxID=578943 RepID=A0A4R6WYS8_9PROT|nr:chlorophyll synthase ChlG [Dongia mobilis]TDQ82947.1 chlorophyll synthase [Dongia mobilis]